VILYLKGGVDRAPVVLCWLYVDSGVLEGVSGLCICFHDADLRNTTYTGR
jgi:hypothetical protein